MAQLILDLAQETASGRLITVLGRWVKLRGTGRLRRGPCKAAIGDYHLTIFNETWIVLGA